MITNETLKKLRNEFPAGARVRLISMDDPYRQDLCEGSKGTVMSVDDMGTVHVCWDCGSSLGVVYGVDQCERIGGKQ